MKTTRFSNPRYIGDPVNTVRIFNDQGADEIFLLDRSRAAAASPDLAVVRAVAGEAFMPLAYGGGIRTLDDARKILNLGVEKVVLGTAVARDLPLLTRIANVYGSQSVVACIDVVRRGWRKQKVITTTAPTATAAGSPADLARAAVEAGAGEILLQAVDRDGTRDGYDLEVLAQVSADVDVPVVACGGAGSLEDLAAAVSAGASAVAAGSLFCFHGPHRAVLVNYPSERRLAELLP